MASGTDAGGMDAVSAASTWGKRWQNFDPQSEAFSAAHKIEHMGYNLTKQVATMFLGALAFTVAKQSPALATVLLIVYPAWDAFDRVLVEMLGEGRCPACEAPIRVALYRANRCDACGARRLAVGPLEDSTCEAALALRHPL